MKRLHRVFNALVVMFTVAALLLPGTSEASTPTQVGCRTTNSYQLNPAGNSLSTGGGSQLHVEFFVSGQPEYETMLPSSATSNGYWSYPPNTAAGGMVWQYNDCSDQQVIDQVNAHIQRRRAGGANNGGYVDRGSTFFLPSGGQPGSPGQPCGTPGQPPCGTPPVPQPPAPGNCVVLSTYAFNPAGNTLSMSGASHIHVEYFVTGHPEVETMLPTSATTTGNWSFTPGVAGGGRVWFFSGCSDQQVLDRINQQIANRRSQGANNAGYRAWRDTFFQPNAALGTSGITPLPPTPAPGQPPIDCTPIKNSRVFNRTPIGDIGEVYTVNGPSVVKAFFWDDNTFINGVAVLLGRSAARAVISGPRLVETWSLPHPDCPLSRLTDAYNEVINRQGAVPYWDVRGQVPGMTVYP